MTKRWLAPFCLLLSCVLAPPAFSADEPAGSDPGATPSNAICRLLDCEPTPTPPPPPVLVVTAKLTRITSGQPGCGYFSIGVVAEYTDIEVIAGSYRKDRFYVVHECPELSRSEISASAGSLESLDIGSYHRLELLNYNFNHLDLVYDDHIKPRLARLYYVLRADPGEGGQSGDLGWSVLSRGVTLTGTITDPDGRPVAGIPLWAVTPIRDESFPPAATSGPDGRFVISNLPPGEVELWACGKRYEYLHERLTVRPPSAKVHLTLQPAATLRGRVLGPDGRPRAGIELFADEIGDELSCMGSWRPCPAGWKATSDSEGRFEIGPLTPGWYDIWADASPWDRIFLPSLPVLAREPVEGLEIRLERGALWGRLIAEGAPVAGAHVTSQSRKGSDQTLSAADGSFRFAGVGAGPVTLRVDAPEPGSQTESIYLLLVRDDSWNAVRGRVVRADGSPIEGADIIHVDTAESTRSADDGSFELAVTESSRVITFDMPPGVFSMVLDLDFAEEEPRG